VTRSNRNPGRRSVSLVVYCLLLKLDPRPFVRIHREELLQDFQDLEQQSPSRSALWHFIASDLAASIWSGVTPIVLGTDSSCLHAIGLDAGIAG